MLGFRGGTGHESNQTLVDLVLIFGVTMGQGLQEGARCLFGFICA